MHLIDAMPKIYALFAGTPEPLLTEALLLCAHGAVTMAPSGTSTVRYGTGSDADTATVEGGACDCDPLAETRQVCAHVIAASLYELLREEEKKSPLDGPLLERHVEKIVSGAMMTEAPYSLNVSVEDPDGYTLQFTVRKQDSREFFEAATALRTWVKKQGFTPKHQWRQPLQEGQAPTQSDAHSTVSGAPSSTQKTYLFHAETLVRSELGGKYVWAVMGADMPAYNKKYGMRAWPEILEAAGFDMATLETTRVGDLPSLKGYIAHYVMRIDDLQKPDKVVRLVKAVP